MIGDLHWRPYSKSQTRVGGMEIRNLIAKKYGAPSMLNCLNLEYLRGLRDAEIDGAQELIDAIEKHSSIEISIEN